MKRIAIIVACLVVTIMRADAGELDKATLEKQVTQLGDDSFRIRRTAQKSIVAEMTTLQETFLDLLAKAEDTPSNELKALTAKLKTFTLLMESVAKTSDDPEIKMRMKKIFAQTFPSLVYDQKLPIQKLIVAEFKKEALEDSGNGKIARVNIYAAEDVAVMEIADLRVIRTGYDKSGHHDTSSRIPVSYSGSWSSSSGSSFSFKAKNGQTNCTWKDWNFTVDREGFAIGDRKIPIGKGKNLVIVDNKGAFKCHFELSR